MADKTGIEWTDATWNPVRGCTRVSEGCRNCYAEGVAARFSGPGQPYEGIAKRIKRLDGRTESRWTGRMMVAPEATLTQPLRWKRPRRIFVNSMSDLFHEGVSDETIDRIFAFMALCPQHTFQVLTKRPERMRTYMDKACGRIADAVMVLRRKTGIGAGTGLAPLPHITPGRAWWPLPNVWLGTSVEDQATADERIPHLLATPAAIRFVSAEPLLGPVDFTEFCTGHYFINSLTGTRWHDQDEDRSGSVDFDGAKLDWIITGGESGPGARPMHPDWARSIRDQCAAAGTAFMFKQWGAWAWASEDKTFDEAERHVALTFGKNVTIQHFGSGRTAAFVGKARAGRLLDGVTHDGYPEVRV